MPGPSSATERERALYLYYRQFIKVIKFNKGSLLLGGSLCVKRELILFHCSCTVYNPFFLICFIGAISSGRNVEIVELMKSEQRGVGLMIIGDE